MITPLDVLSIETWILLATVVVLIRYYIHRQWQFLAKLGIPHDPPSVLGLGNLSTALHDMETFFTKDLEYKKKYGKVYGFYMALTPRIMIWDREVIQQIQIKQFSSFRDRQRSFQKLNGKELNTGLTIASGEQWKRIRHTLSPTFSSAKLKDMFGIVVKCTDHMVENLKKKVSENEGKFEPKEIMGQLSLDCVCSSAFGVNAHTQEGGEEPKVLQMAKKLFKRSPMAILSLFFFLFPSTEKIGELFNFCVLPRDIIKYFSSLVDAMIKSKTELGDEARVDFLKCMLEGEIDEKETKNATKGMSRIEIVGNSIVMILAGYETTSSTLIFVAYNLAVHKECQEKLRQEIKDTIEKYGSLTYEAINSMKYLMMCINESLRIYPPAIRNSRFCEEDVTINGIHIPKGVHVDFSIYGFGRDPDNWDEPLKYKPERFEDMSKIDPIIFQPFGAGPRMCIGMRFALMEVKIALCKIIQTFQLDPADDTPEPPLEIVFRASLAPKVDKLHLKATPLEEK